MTSSSAAFRRPDTMTDRDDFGSFRPTRDDVPSAGRAKPLRGQPPGPAKAEPGFAPGPHRQAAAPQPVAPPYASPQNGSRPVPPPPRVEQPDFDELIEALPRVARTGPARPTGRQAGVPPAPVFQPSQAPKPSHRSLDSLEDDDEARRGLPRVLKWTGYTILGGAIAAVAGAIALMLYTPVDLVRDRLVAEVKARTGRDLHIGGKPTISFWPNVAVSVTDVTLSNAPGMSGAPLVSMPRLDATIQLWPLLSKQMLVDRVVLQSPRIALTTDAQGRRNWDFADAQLFPAGPRRVQYAKVGPLDLNDLPEDLRDFAKGATDAKRVARTGGTAGFALARVRIIDGTVVHTDARARTSEDFKAIDMTIDAGDAKGPLQASGTFVWQGETVRLDTRVMPLQSLASGAPAQTTIALTSAAGQVTFAGTASGGASAKFDGRVTARSPSIAKASQWLGRPVVGEMANGPFTFKGRVSASGTKLGISDTLVTAPDLHLTGALTLDQSGARPKLSGSVRVADLNLEAFLRLRVLEAPPRTAAPVAGARQASPASPQSIEDLLTEPAAKPPASKTQVRGYVGRDGWRETPLDLSALGFGDADVRLAFGRMTSNTLNTNQGQVHLVVNGRTARFAVDDLALHDGKARGTVVLDAAHAKPVLTIAMTMDGVALGPLLKDAGAEGLDGRAKVTLNVSGMGHTERQIVDTLAGKAEISVPRGTITGYDVGAIVKGLAQMKLPRGEPDPSAKTDFTDLGAAFTIAKGIADNRDFRIVTREARAIGNGQIALGARTIDFVVRPKVTAPVETPAGLGGPGLNLAALDLPIRITGPLAKPNVAADFQALAANPAKALEAIDPTTRREVEDTVKGVLAGDDAAKAKAQDMLNKLLGR